MSETIGLANKRVQAQRQWMCNGVHGRATTHVDTVASKDSKTMGIEGDMDFCHDRCVWFRGPLVLVLSHFYVESVPTDTSGKG